jgi:hypothetical protein
MVCTGHDGRGSAAKVPLITGNTRNVPSSASIAPAMPKQKASVRVMSALSAMTAQKLK